MSKKILLITITLLFTSSLLNACYLNIGNRDSSEQITTQPIQDIPSLDSLESIDTVSLLTGFLASITPDTGYGSVTAADLNLELEGAAPFLVDVRQPSEIESNGYISGAVNIPIRGLLDNLERLPGPVIPIVIYDDTGHRGAMGMMALRLLGYSNVRNLSGGIGSWKNAGLPLVTGSQPSDPAILSARIVSDEALFSKLNAFLNLLPTGFLAVKPDALAAELAGSGPPVLIDIRKQFEWDQGYIAGATFLDFQTMMPRLDQLPADKNTNIVVYGSNAHRGGMAVLAFYLLGYTNVRNLSGGIYSWISSGQPITEPAHP